MDPADEDLKVSQTSPILWNLLWPLSDLVWPHVDLIKWPSCDLASDRNHVKVIERWIQIAYESFKLKNFSSLRAIISGLQTHGVHRLKKTWSAVSPESLSQFSQMQGISKESNNSLNSIPYLGHLLTDLMMIDAAYPDKLRLVSDYDVITT